MDQQDGEHYSGSGGMRRREEGLLMEDDGKYLEMREVKLRDEIARLRGDTREDSRNIWGSESAERWKESTKYSEGWGHHSKSRISGKESILGEIPRGREESRKREPRFRDEMLGDDRNLMITVDRQGSEESARYRDRMIVQEELRKEAERVEWEQKRLARQKEEEARREERRKEDARRREQERRKEEKHRVEERRKKEEKRAAEEKRKEDERRKAEEKRKEEEKRRIEEERKQMEAEITSLREAEKIEAAKISELLNKLEELKSSRIAREVKMKEEEEEVKKEKEKRRERDEKAEEEELKRRQEVEATRVKLDAEFAAKQEQVAQQWEEFLKETKQTEVAQKRKESTRSKKVKPQEKVRASSSLASTSRSKSGELVQPKLLSPTSTKAKKAPSAETPNNPVSVVPSGSPLSSAGPRSILPVKLGRSQVEGTGKEVLSHGATYDTGEKGSKGTRKIIKVLKRVKAKKESEEDSADFSSFDVDHGKAPVSLSVSKESIQSLTLSSSKMDEIAASLSEFARTAKEKCHSGQDQQASSATIADDDVSDTHFFIDASGSGGQFEEQLKASRQQEEEKVPNKSTSKKQVCIPGLDLKEPRTRKGSGSQKSPQVNTMKMKQAGTGKGAGVVEGGTKSGRSVPSHETPGQPPSKVRKTVGEEERRYSHGDRRRQGHEDVVHRQRHQVRGRGKVSSNVSLVSPPPPMWNPGGIQQESRTGQMRQQTFGGRSSSTEGLGFASPSPSSERWLGHDGMGIRGRPAQYTQRQVGDDGNYLDIQW